MSKLKITLAASFLIALMGCGEAKTPSTNSTKETSPPPISTNTPQAAQSLPNQSPTAASPPLNSNNTSQPANSSLSKSKKPAASKPLPPPASPAFTISPEGIGPAKVGMTLGQLKQLLGDKAEFKTKSPFIVDFDAIAVSQAGEEQYYILYPAQLPLANTDVIEALATNNPKYRTAQGVGPGVTIAQAEAVYGDATLSYNTLNESREYVKFTKLPTKAIAFRSKAPQGEQLAGIYPSSSTELKETKKFQKTASISLVEVYCRQNCPLPEP
jgi:hypothetical protein